VSQVFLPIYRTYYNSMAPIYESNKLQNKVEYTQDKNTSYELTLYNKKGNLVTTQVKL